VNADFGSILLGLMANRRLTREALSRASGRSLSTIAHVLAGTTAPTAEILQDIAPALQMAVADLLVIAGLPTDYDADRRGPYRASHEIGSLVAAASWLTPGQLKQITELAQQLRPDDGDLLFNYWD
jgi:transcriptional regulator with XRE-family HTH domain